MGSFTCCIWWLVFGVLLGWLLSWWLSKLIGNKVEEVVEEIEPQPSLKERFFDDPVPHDRDDFVPSTLQTEPESEQASQPQAAISTLSREDMMKAAAAVGISFSGKRNDLEIIEGIGPKIAELLEANGINTFDELSRASIVNLEQILEQGGERFRMANPGTWAEQAALAAENKWAELKALQDSLDGGVDKSN
jgi:predicted flap endonuclease-1-like 5' DNA nuclease